MKKTVDSEMHLANGDKVCVQTSTRQAKEGDKGTFISINTGYFRIRIVQRISLNDLMPPRATIGFSTTSETDNLTDIETLALSLEEAIKIAEQLNEKVAKKNVPEPEAYNVKSKSVG
jgi:hypothetical protein